MADLKISIAKRNGKRGEVYLVMDACRSNELFGGARGRAFSVQPFQKQRQGRSLCFSSADKSHLKTPVLVTGMVYLPGTWWMDWRNGG